jgi:hypothetical protein
MAIDTTSLIQELSGELNDKAYEASDSLGHVGSEEVVVAMIELLNNPNPESRYMAARTLGLIENNAAALAPLLEAIKNKENTDIVGDLLLALEGFDISTCYVDIFKLHLFGSFKVSSIAKDLLDHKEFAITPRVIRKAQKHWEHYSNNVKQDEVYALRKIEVEEMLNDLKSYIDQLG